MINTKRITWIIILICTILQSQLQSSQMAQKDEVALRLWEAVRDLNSEKLEYWLMKEDADVTEITASRRTLLIYALDSIKAKQNPRESAKIVQLLLNKAKQQSSASRLHTWINKRISGSENTALIFAIYNKNYDAAKMLLENGADWTIKNVKGKSAEKIAKNDFPEIYSLIQSYVSSMPSLEKPSESSASSSSSSSSAIPQKKRPRLEVEQNESNKLLDDAIENGTPAEVARSLINGADVNARLGSAQLTPLMMAIIDRNDAAIISILLAFGADMTARDTKGKTARDYASNSIKAILDAYENHEKHELPAPPGGATA